MNNDELLPLSAIWEEDDKEQVKEKVSEKLKKRTDNGGKQEDIILDENISSDEDDNEDNSYSSSSEEDEEGANQEEENPFDEINETEDTKPLKNVISALEKAAPKEAKKISTLVNDTAKDSQYSLPTSSTSISFADMLAGVDGVKDRSFYIDHRSSFVL